MMTGYSLLLFQPIKASSEGSRFIGDITDIATDWRRSIRMQGGYWLGSFEYIDKPQLCEEFFRTYLGYEIREYVGGLQTWEGIIAEMIYDPFIDENGFASVQVNLIGYVHTLQWRYCTVGGEADYANLYIESIIDTDAEFLQKGRIDSNLTKVQFSRKINQRVWDEINQITDMGDTDGNPWRFYVGNDRRANYHKIDVDPIYYIKSGIKRRRSLTDMENSIVGQYEGGEGKMHNLTPVNNDESIAKYGRREGDLFVSNVDIEPATQMQHLQLSEYAWPWARVENLEEAIVYGNINDIVSINPYLVVPAIVRDVNYPAKGQEHGSWLKDLRDFFIEEVEVSQDGLALRSGETTLESLIPRDAFNKRGNRRQRMVQKMRKYQGGVPSKSGAGGWSDPSQMAAWYQAHKERKTNK